MTAIVCYNGVLYGDRAYSSGTLPFRLHVDGDKVLVSECKSFAYGMAGFNVLDHIAKDKLEKLLMGVYIYMTCIDIQRELKIDVREGIVPETSAEIFKQLDEVLTTTGWCTLIVMFKTIHLILRRSHSQSELTISLKSNQVATSEGTGGDLLLTALLTGASPQEAIEIASSIDPFTGTVIDIVESKKLKSVKIGGVVKS